MEFYIIAACVGGALGILMYIITQKFIKKRTGEKAKGLLFSKRFSFLIWMMLGLMGCLGIAFLRLDLTSSIEYMAIFLILLSLSVVDGNIRKIPNELLLVLMLQKIAVVAIRGNWAALLPALGGSVIGLVLFMIPSRWGMSIGWGDVKLAIVAGFYLGIMGLFQAVVIMGAVLGLYGLYLLITKKGSLKSKVAIGPALSLGILATLLYSFTITL